MFRILFGVLRHVLVLKVSLTPHTTPQILNVYFIASQPLRALRPHGHRAAGALLLPGLGSVDPGKVRRGKESHQNYNEQLQGKFRAPGLG